MGAVRTLLGVLINHIDVRRGPRHALRARDGGLCAIALLRVRLTLVATSSGAGVQASHKCDVAALETYTACTETVRHVLTGMWALCHFYLA